MKKNKSNNDLTFEKVWLLFQETDKKFQETDKKLQETERILIEMFQETDKKFKETEKMFQETEKMFQETDKKFKETEKMFQETDKKFQETDKKFKETAKKLGQLEELFVGQWGKLTEALVEGELVKILRERNIDVTGVSSRRYKLFEGKEYEFDLIAENGDELVVVEVKTSLYQKHIDHFIDKLKKFKDIFPQYKNYKIYGAVAFIKSGTEVRKYAYKKGLFVIRAVGESAKIINDEKFVPKEF